MSRQNDRAGGSLEPPRQPKSHIPGALRPLWHDWDILDLRVTLLPKSVTTFDLWEAFRPVGEIDIVDINVNRQGIREGSAKIRFKPAPKNDFISVCGGKYPIYVNSLGRIWYAPIALYQTQKKQFTIKSPIREGVVYREFISLRAESLDFGVLSSASHMRILSNRQAKEDSKVRFSLNLRRKQLFVNFHAINAGQMAEYRLTVPMEMLEKISQIRDKENRLIFVLSLRNAPHFHRKYSDVADTHTVEDNSWKDDYRWFRQTDIAATRADHDAKAFLPIDLKQSRVTTKLGRWTTYRITFNDDKIDREKAEQISCALQDHNIPIARVDDFKFSKQQEAIWDFVDDAHSRTQRELSLEEELLAANGDPLYSLSFPVRYALEMCISNNHLSEYALDETFVEQLGKLTEVQAVYLLEYIIQKDLKFYDPMEIFNLWRPKLPPRKPKLPTNCYMMRSVIVTPTTIIVKEPAVEVTNRIIRQYEHQADRFLRVRFEDDEFRGSRRIYGSELGTMDEVYSRVHRTLINGIVIGGRKYEFLAYGNSQLRDHGAYFFAPTATINASSIRAWMGRFDHEKIIAKHAARIGQCFSTTKAVRGATLEPVREADLIPDIERNGYTFSDGVGKISPFLAELVSMDLGLTTKAGGTPSIFQFRLSGCKGILAVTRSDDKSVKWNGLALRKSQHKFDADHHRLEVIRHSEFWGACFNRQLILVLSHLGVPDSTFLRHQEEEISGLREALEDDAIAMSKLYEYVDPNQAVTFIAGLVADGFRNRDPFTISLLRLWRAWRTKDLKDKARLKVKQGACLLGCVDETATLRGHFEADEGRESASYEERVRALPEIFVQVSRPESPGTVDIIEGICILARNPSLHPGDIRVVRAVNVPILHHLKDTVVLPQTGDRDLSSMCSGGDLDGDDYIVIWDQDYIPETWNHAPMDYSAPEPKRVATSVTANDIMRFFVQYMKNDILGRIAHAHLAWADYLDDGISSDRCLELAVLHSKAVDYPKTGQPAKMPRSLNPRKWPHFMQKNRDSSYRSPKVLGKLFDNVEEVAFVPDYETTFDERLLSAFTVDEAILNDALELKESYDEHISRIMALHEIKTEFEVFSTLCLGHSQASRDYKFHEDLGWLSSSLKQQFKDECIRRAGGADYEHLAPYAVAMYKVTCVQVQAALAHYAELKTALKPENMPFITFPWVMQPILSEIVSRHRQSSSQFQFLEEYSKGSIAEPEEMASTEEDRPTISARDIEDITVQSSELETDAAEGKSGQTSTSPAVFEESVERGLSQGTYHTLELRNMANPAAPVITGAETGNRVSNTSKSITVHENPQFPFPSMKEARADDVRENVGPEQTSDAAATPTGTVSSIYEIQKSTPLNLSINTRQPSIGASFEDISPLTKVDPDLSCPPPANRRRRMYGSSRESSNTARSAEIDALLAQSDKLLEDRRLSRTQNSDSSSLLTTTDILQPLTPLSEDIDKAKSTSSSEASNDKGPSLEQATNIAFSPDSSNIPRKPRQAERDYSGTHVPSNAASDVQTLIFTEDDDTFGSEVFVPTTRAGRTALERLANLVHEHE